MHFLGSTRSQGEPCVRLEKKWRVGTHHRQICPWRSVQIKSSCSNLSPLIRRTALSYIPDEVLIRMTSQALLESWHNWHRCHIVSIACSHILLVHEVWHSIESDHVVLKQSQILRSMTLPASYIVQDSGQYDRWKQCDYHGHCVENQPENFLSRSTGFIPEDRITLDSIRLINFGNSSVNLAQKSSKKKVFGRNGTNDIRIRIVALVD